MFSGQCFIGPMDFPERVCAIPVKPTFCQKIKNKEMRYRDSWQAEKNGTRFEFTDTISGKGN